MTTFLRTVKGVDRCAEAINSKIRQDKDYTQAKLKLEQKQSTNLPASISTADGFQIASMILWGEGMGYSSLNQYQNALRKAICNFTNQRTIKKFEHRLHKT